MERTPAVILLVNYGCYHMYSMKRTIFIFGIVAIVVLVRGQEDIAARLSDAALLLISQEVVYDPAYYSIGYPNGDVPEGRGVCSDVIIRTYRQLGLDLQKEVHEDMADHFDQYPDIWGLSRPDPNIDHRRVPNLMKFFKRKGREKEITNNAVTIISGRIISSSVSAGKSSVSNSPVFFTDSLPLCMDSNSTCWDGWPICSKSTCAVARVACPHRLTSTSGVNHRIS